MRAGSGLLVLALALAACTDPRARPVPPLVRLAFSPTHRVTSPGTVLSSLYAYDDDGLKDLALRLRAGDGTVLLDSSVFFGAEVEQIRPIVLAVPAGLAIGTRLTLLVTVGDHAGFSTSDSAVFTTQDTVLLGR